MSHYPLDSYELQQLEDQLRMYYPIRLRRPGYNTTVHVDTDDTYETLFTFEPESGYVNTNCTEIDNKLSQMLGKMLNIHNTSAEVVRFRRVLCGTSRNWTNALLDVEKMSAFFTVTCLFDSKKRHAVVTFSSKSIYGYFSHTAHLKKSSGLFRLCDENLYEIQLLKNPSRPEITVSTHTNDSDEVKLDDVEFKVSLPNSSYGSFVHTEVLRHEGLVYHIRLYVVTELGYSGMKYSANEHLITKINGKRVKGKEVKGRLECQTTPLKIPDWLLTLKDRLAKVKNPYNVLAHPYLLGEPLYEDNEYFVTSSEDVYVNHKNSWLPINGGLGYIKKNYKSIGGGLAKWYERYALLQRLSE